MGICGNFTNPLGEDKSKVLPFLSGVFLGSILGPLQFLLFVNEFPSSISSKNLLYANDTTLVSKNNNLNTLLTETEIQINSANTWLIKKQLSLNLNKAETHAYDN